MSHKPVAMRDAFLNRIWQTMAKDEKVFFICADFGSPVLDRIRSDFPHRFMNVGIAEQNLINVSAGLALEGFSVFAYAIAPFITMRCYEQIRVNLALLSHVRKMNVTLIGVGAGYSYVVSGPTHQCFEDITIMRALPGVSVLSPADHIFAEALFDICNSRGGINYLRLDAQILPVIYDTAPLTAGQGFHQLKSGGALCFVATGFMVHTALNVAAALEKTGHQVGVIDVFDLTCFSIEKLRDALAPYTGIVSMEEGFCGCGGMDSLMFDFLARHGLAARMLNVGIEASYHFELGTRAELHENVGIGPISLERKVRAFLEKSGIR